MREVEVFFCGSFVGSAVRVSIGPLA